MPISVERPDGERVDLRGRRAGALDRQPVAGELAGDPLRHLAARRVGDAEEEDAHGSRGDRLADVDGREAELGSADRARSESRAGGRRQRGPHRRSRPVENRSSSGGRSAAAGRPCAGDRRPACSPCGRRAGRLEKAPRGAAKRSKARAPGPRSSGRRRARPRPASPGYAGERGARGPWRSPRGRRARVGVGRFVDSACHEL